MNLKSKKISIYFVALLFFLSVSMFSLTSNAFASNGTVTCSTSNVVGIWIEVSGGKSGWAARNSTSDPRVNSWSYDTQGKKWRAHVGCGGTPEKWAKNIKSNWTTRQSVSTISCADIGYFPTCRIG